MRILARLLWIAAFLLATYSWMVAFEHGFAWDKFQKGFRVEWRNLGDNLNCMKEIYNSDYGYKDVAARVESSYV